MPLGSVRKQVDDAVQTARSVRGRLRGRQQVLQLIGCELAKLPAAKRAFHGNRPHVRALNAAHESTLTLKQLTRLFPARAASNEGVPAIGGLAARSLTKCHFNAVATVERALENVFKLLGAELAQNANAELADEVAYRALQLYAELAVGRYQLEATIHARHGTYGDETATRTGRQPLNQCGTGRRIATLSVGDCVRIQLRQALARRAVTDEGGNGTARITLTNQTPVEAYLVR